MIPRDIIFRLVLARAFLLSSKQRLARLSDVTAIALAVVALHDCLDNLLGAVASANNLSPKQEKATLLHTFAAIDTAKPGTLGPKTSFERLNALRVEIKHHGIVPNVQETGVLIEELETTADRISSLYFGMPLSHISLVEMVRDEEKRGELRRIAALIDNEDYKEALVECASANFRAFEEIHLTIKLAALTIFPDSGAAISQKQRIFYEADIERLKYEMIGAGISLEEFHLFKNLVPTVGWSNYEEKTVTFKKDSDYWHPANWNETNARFCLDVLTRRLANRNGTVIAAKAVSARFNYLVTFLRDSEVTIHRDGKDLKETISAGTEVQTWVAEYADGDWQGEISKQSMIGPLREGDKFTFVRREDIKVSDEPV